MPSIPLSKAISRYLVPWLQIDWPIDWRGIFGREAPLIVEAGFGNGAFLVEQAVANPDTNFVGLERSWGAAQRLFKRLHGDNLTNVRVLQGDAAFALRRVFGPESLTQVYVNFSDPWPKERHHGRRLVQPAFVKLLSERLLPDGHVTIATDHAEYAEWISEVLTAQSLLASIYPTPEVDALPGRNPTKYESKAISAGVPIHYFVWRRSAEAASSLQEEKVEAMPNVVLEGAPDASGVLTDTAHQTWRMKDREVSVVVKLEDVYSDARGGKMVEMMVKEDELNQHIGVLILPRPNDRLLVKLSPIGHPRPTFGVKQAVGKVAELVAETTPDLRVVSTTVNAVDDD
jgi:tRNA (guanine-N7-)-methyltransferase